MKRLKGAYKYLCAHTACEESGDPRERWRWRHCQLARQKLQRQMQLRLEAGPSVALSQQ